MKLRPFVLAGVVCVAAGVAAGSVRAEEGSFLNRFKGNWSGAGTVMDHAMPLRVSCSATGEPAQNHIVVQGNCGIAIISRQMIADLTFDPRSGRYIGTYTGSKVGPARLSGKRQGDTIDLVITWPKPVNGDTKAKLLIENPGNGSLRIMVNDNPAVGAPVVRTSDLVFSQP
jgi:hypothetical protein